MFLKPPESGRDNRRRRYDVIMTGRLQEALRRIEALSPHEQDTIASQIMDTLDDEKGWAERLRNLPSELRELARAAREEHRAGNTRPLDEMIR